MNIHPISGWLRIVFNILLCIAILFVCLACFLDCVINKTGISLRFILYIVLIFGVKFLMESCLLALNKYSGNALVFTKEYILYKGNKYFVDEVSLKYFKFQWTFLESVIVFPKLVIVIPNAKNIICPVTKRELRRLETHLGYKIIKI